MKHKSVIAAALMIAGAQASAAELATPGTGDGSLFLSAFDLVNETSYVFNTGLTIQGLESSTGATIMLDSVFNNFLGASNAANIQWNLFAGSTGAASPYTFANQFGGIVASAGAGVGVNAVNQNIASSNSTANDFSGVVNNQFDGTTFSGCAIGSADACFSDSLTDAFNAGRDLPPAWESNYGAGVNFDTTGSLDETLSLFLLTTGTESSGFGGETALSSTPVEITQLLSATLFGNGKLQIGDVTPVPLPAAIWLMGAGLAGLIGVSRRKVAA